MDRHLLRSIAHSPSIPRRNHGQHDHRLTLHVTRHAGDQVSTESCSVEGHTRSPGVLPVSLSLTYRHCNQTYAKNVRRLTMLIGPFLRASCVAPAAAGTPTSRHHYQLPPNVLSIELRYRFGPRPCRFHTLSQRAWPGAPPRVCAGFSSLQGSPSSLWCPRWLGTRCQTPRFAKRQPSSVRSPEWRNSRWPRRPHRSWYRSRPSEARLLARPLPLRGRPYPRFSERRGRMRSGERCLV